MKKKNVDVSIFIMDKNLWKEVNFENDIYSITNGINAILYFLNTSTFWRWYYKKIKVRMREVSTRAWSAFKVTSRIYPPQMKGSSVWMFILQGLDSNESRETWGLDWRILQWRLSYCFHLQPHTTSIMDKMSTTERISKPVWESLSGEKGSTREERMAMRALPSGESGKYS